MGSHVSFSTKDVSWQASLANSAVSAAEDVRSAVRAAKTAENAKAAASAAAYAAQSACDAGGFPSIDEARAAQTRASIAQSHAFHAAVVDHEAKAVKRRATLALAHDVKCWNVHRKREMLQACLAHARSQHEATRRAVDAWSCLRDGYIGSNAIPSTQTRKAAPQASSPSNRSRRKMKDAPPLAPVVTGLQYSVPPPANADILSADSFAELLGNSSTSGNSTPFQKSSSKRSINASGEILDYPVTAARSYDAQNESEHEEPTATIYQDSTSSNVIVAVDHNVLTNQEDDVSRIFARNSEDALNKSSSSGSGMFPFAQPVLPLVTAAPVAEISVAEENVTPEERQPPKVKEENDKMSASMQSLVDGLMTWGDQFEADDVFALPQGMAASIAFEESGGSPQGTF